MPRHPFHASVARLPLCAAALALVHCAAEPPPVAPSAEEFPFARAPGAQPAPAPGVEHYAVAPPPGAEHAPAPAEHAPAEHAPAEAHAGPPHWTYSGEEGAGHWGDLSADYAACKTGAHQSPIDIVTTRTQAERSRLPLEISYPAVPLRIFNNGHTVQVSNSTAASMKVGGDTWKLVQFHFHSPSEHQVDGKNLDLELHLVHKSEKGELSVVGLLFKKGKENRSLAPVLDHVPAEVSKEASPVEGVNVDLSSLVPAKARYYTYDGSLTTPPCSEGVHWYVMSTVGEVSDAQLQQFRGATHGDTNRPVMARGARRVALSN
jgi:carbonic anhydrase